MEELAGRVAYSLEQMKQRWQRWNPLTNESSTDDYDSDDDS
jgi:hypothetical protein